MGGGGDNGGGEGKGEGVLGGAGLSCGGEGGGGEGSRGGSGEGGGDGNGGGGNGAGGAGGGGSTVNDVFTRAAIVGRRSLDCQLELVAIAVRSPPMSADAVPLYAQFWYARLDHPRTLVLRASTPFVSPRGIPL